MEGFPPQMHLATSLSPDAFLTSLLTGGWTPRLVWLDPVLFYLCFCGARFSENLFWIGRFLLLVCDDIIADFLMDTHGQIPGMCNGLLKVL